LDFKEVVLESFKVACCQCDLGTGILSVVLWNELFKKRFKEFLNLQKES
jgi:hypothetical protein